MEEEIKNLSYLQIFIYFNYKEIENTSFYCLYSNGGNDFLLFINKDNDNAICVIDVYKRSIISKNDLILKLSKKINLIDVVKEIELIDKKDFKIDEPISEDDLINYHYGFLPLEKDNKNIKSYSSEFLFSNQFKNIYQDAEENIIIPLFFNEQVVNYILENENKRKAKFHEPVGYYNSLLSEENYKVIFSFGIFNILKYFSINLNTAFYSVIINDVNYKNVNAILNDIQDKSFEKYIFLYNEDNIEDLISVLDLFITFSCIQSNFKLFLNKYPGKLILKIFNPKEFKTLKITQFFENLNQSVLELLGISKDDDEKKIQMKNFLFDIYNSQILSFEPKVDMIKILLEHLNKLIFGDDSMIEFLNVKDIVTNANDDDFDSLY